jgi:succinate dehydrogenase assembly factor 2
MLSLSRVYNLGKFSSGLSRCAIQATSLRFNSGSKTPSDSEFVQVIHSNEDKYFEEVKKSFNNLKKVRSTETVEEKRARLLYQSRKRGTAENGLLVGNFSAKFLPTMTEKELDEFDKVINDLHNEWDLYYWITNAVKIPAELESNSVLRNMKKFCSNESGENRTLQPDLQKVKRWEL